MNHLFYFILFYFVVVVVIMLVTMGWEFIFNRWSMKCIQNFGGENYWKVGDNILKKIWEDNIKTELWEVICGNVKWAD